MSRPKVVTVSLVIVAMIFTVSYILSEKKECENSENFDDLLILEQKKCPCERKQWQKDPTNGKIKT